MTTLHLTVPEDAWQPASTTGSWLMASLNINGLPMHLEAWEVVKGDGIEQDVPEGSPIRTDHLDALAEAVSADEPWQTTTIGGREYIIVATPHC